VKFELRLSQVAGQYFLERECSSVYNG